MNSSAARAPGRGRYDRSLSASERARRRRQLLVTAARELFIVGETFSLESVLRRTGLGRNTFYGHFENVDALRKEVVAVALESFCLPGRGMLQSATPIGAVRAFAEAWVERISIHPKDASVVLFVGRDLLTEELSEHILVLGRFGQRAGIFGSGDDPMRAACVAAGIAEASLIALRSASDLKALQALIEDLVLRILR